MDGRTAHRQNARGVKALSLLYLALAAAALVLVHGQSYEPAVAYIPLYFVASLGVTGAVASLLLPTNQFTAGFSAGAYALCAAFVAMMVFFSGGVSSELHLLYFPLLLVSALHGKRWVGIVALVSVLATYFLAAMPTLLTGQSEAPSLTFFRLFAFLLVGGVLLAARSEVAEEDGSVEESDATLQEQVEEEVSARRGVPVAVILVDPGGVEDLDLLLERVRARIGEPVLVGEGYVFGVVLSGVDDRAVESAARRALAAASSLGSEETRAGAAIYPRDARSADDLLVAAGKALEAAFEVESPSAIVFAGRGGGGAESRSRAAR